MGYSMRTPVWRYTEWALFPCGAFLGNYTSNLLFRV